MHVREEISNKDVVGLLQFRKRERNQLTYSGFLSPRRMGNWNKASLQGFYNFREGKRN